jgi:transcriptional regulator with GAF, ATPase, and Fis domain/ligand-binding sensor domain-containing protein
MGLPGAVTALMFDADGFLWIGSYRDGLSRYDGERFVYFTTGDGLAHDHVQAMCQDLSGLLWFATEGGVSCHDGTSFISYTTADGLPDDDVRAVLQDKVGSIWLGTRSGLVRHDGSRFDCFGLSEGLVDLQVNALVEDRDGDLWIGTQRGLSRWDGRVLHGYGRGDGLSVDGIDALAMDADGRLWIGGREGVNCRYQGRFGAPHGMQGQLAGVRAITCCDDGQVWFGTEHGLRQTQRPHSHPDWAHISTRDGLVNNQIRSIVQDSAANFWVGTSGGISQYSRTFTSLTTAHGLVHDDVRAVIHCGDGILWLGTGAGLSRYDGLAFANFTTAEGLVGDRVHGLLQDRDGSLWIGTDCGLSQYDGHSFTNYTTDDGLPDRAIYDLMQARDGSLWLATDRGVSRFDGQGFTTLTTDDGLICNDVSQVIQDDAGTYWIATEGGISRYDGEAFTSFTVDEGLISNKVDAIMQDRDGRIWITALGGVSIYADGVFTHLTVADGLASDKVLQSFQDSRGEMWFASWGGVCRYDGAVIQTLTREDGLAGTFVASLAEDDIGQMWFATSRGITCYCRPASSPAPVTIRSVVADRRYVDCTDLRVPASNGLMAIEYQAVSFTTRPQAMVYRYRLRGWDEDWRATQARRVEFQDLPPGRYVFEVVAVDRDLNYTRPETLKLEVVPDQRDEEIGELSGKVRAHAQDLLRKNVALDQARKAVQTADERLDMFADQEASRWGIDGFVGKSRTIRQILTEVRQVQGAGTISVLVTGESGTGKELIARAIHFGGQRAQGPFIPVNCSAIPGELAESTLFGHIRGAFTGAHTDRQGAFELADGGTLFLDEIGDMPLPLQAKILRVLEDGLVNPLGSSHERRVDVRVVAATNVDLPSRIATGAFRQDLYYRLARLPVHLPPLRERQEDIGLLAEHFLRLFADEMGIQDAQLSAAARVALEAYAFPGNVRELKNIIEYALIRTGGAPIGVQDLTMVAQATRVPPAPAVTSSTQTAEDRVLAYVRERGSINNAECRALLALEYDQTSYILKKMRRRGLLRQVGERRWTRYEQFP